MSALPPKADIGTQSWNVRFVPKADIAEQTQSLTLPLSPEPTVMGQCRRSENGSAVYSRAQAKTKTPVVRPGFSVSRD
jgi:hypothetical protein